MSMTRRVKALEYLGGSDRGSLRADLREEVERLAHILSRSRRARRHAGGIGRRPLPATPKLLGAIRERPDLRTLLSGYVNTATPADRLTKSGPSDDAL